MLTKQKKANAIKKTQKHDSDTGSSEAQVAILSRRIDNLTTHLKRNKKDRHSRRGLLKMVENRRKHMNYLKTKSDNSYKKIVSVLGLKK